MGSARLDLIHHLRHHQLGPGVQWYGMVEWYMRHEVFEWRFCLSCWVYGSWVGLGGSNYGFYIFPSFSFARWTSQGCFDGADEQLFTYALLAGLSYTPR
jgi:hypothetical protein